jgi:heat shock protein HtpX
MNLYDQQRSNRRKTWLVMLAFVGFLLLLGAGFDVFFIGAGGGFVPVGSLAALGIGSASAAASYFSGDRAVLLSSHAQPVADVEAAASDTEKLKLRQLENVVD